MSLPPHPARCPRRLAAALLGLSLLGGALPARADVVVRLQDIKFQPRQIPAQQGETVVFVNDDPFEHDVYLVRTADPNQVLQPATVLGPGDTLTVAVEEEGLFSLYCTIHGGMRGRVSTTGSFELTAAEKEAAASRHSLPPAVATGEELFWGAAQCHQCHRIGDRGHGTRGPDLSDMGFRAPLRARKLGLGSGTEYLTESILDPGAHVVEGYTDDMARVWAEPIGLEADQIEAVIAYLQSLGGQVDTWSIDVRPSRLEREPTLNPFRAGNAERGRRVFVKVGQCGSCHTVGDRVATSAGPDLSQIGAYRHWTWLAESILYPNAEIGAHWRYATVYYTPEDSRFARQRKATGFLRGQDSKEVRLLVGAEIRAFPADRVERVREHAESKMPANYRELLTFQQLDDLIAYLESLDGS